MEQTAYGTKNDKKSPFFSTTGIDSGLYNKKKNRNLMPLTAIKTKPKFSIFFLLLSKRHKKEIIVMR